MKLERKDWVNAKRKYLYTDISYDALAREIGISRQGIMRGFKRVFPKVNFPERKAEEKLKRDNLAIEKQAEKRVASELQAAASKDREVAVVDAMDKRHLSIITRALDMAEESLENGTLKPKDIKDIKELVNLERMIADKRTTNDKVIIIKAEIPDDVEPLPEIIEGDFDEVT